MDYRAVMASLERGVVAPVYLLTGEEILLRERLLKKFQEKLLPKEMADFNLDIVDGKEISSESIANFASTLPFMSDKRIVIVNNAEVFKTKKKAGKEKEDADTGGDEGLVAYLENPSTSTCLIFVCTEGVDKRKKIYKAVEKNGQVVNIDPPKGAELLTWIERQVNAQGKQIDRGAVEFLASAVGGNLAQLEQEVDKLITYISARMRIELEDAQLLVTKSVESTIFQLVDAVGERKYANALGVLKEMIFLGEPPVRIVIMIARQFRLILQAKVLQEKGCNPKEIAAQLQVAPFVAQKCLGQGRNFTEAELKQALGYLLQLDLNIKTGQIEPVLGLEMALVQICA